MTDSRSVLSRAFASIVRPLALAAACAVAACSGGDDDKTPAAAAGGSVSGEDIVNVDDLLVEDTGAGATKVGDPAVWLETARQEGKQAYGFARAVLGKMSEFAQATAPTRQGTLPTGAPFAVWKADKDGVTYVMTVARPADNRVRYYLEGRKGADRKPLLTGVFIKRASKRGVGRLHMNLGNMNELTGAPAATGNLHLWFSNAGDARARRFRYREVHPKNLGQDAAINYGLDAIHWPGKGGLLRSYAVGDLGSRIPDLADLKGVQLAALRARWTPEGGRAGVAVFNVTKDGLTKLGDAHECWEGGGLRKAYKSFTNKETDGDTVQAVNCGGVEEQPPPAEAPADGIADAEADAELGDALGITEDDAGATLDAGE